MSGQGDLTWAAVIKDARLKGDTTNLCPEDGGPVVKGMEPL